jgi:hypothetical protein
MVSVCMQTGRLPYAAALSMTGHEALAGCTKSPGSRGSLIPVGGAVHQACSLSLPVAVVTCSFVPTSERSVLFAVVQCVLRVCWEKIGAPVHALALGMHSAGYPGIIACGARMLAKKTVHI